MSSPIATKRKAKTGESTTSSSVRHRLVEDQLRRRVARHAIRFSCCTPLGCSHVRRDRARAAVRGLRRRGARRLPARSGLVRAARARGAEGDVARGIRLRRGRRRHRGDDAREPRRVRALAHRPADAARRLDARHDRRRARHAAAEPVRPLPDRRARDGAPRRRRRRRARRGSRGHPVRLLEPGVAADGGDRAGDGRRAALVPALLEHVERARREPRLARRALRLLGDRAHARHDDARLADPRPRPRVPAVPPREGHRAVHERPGLRRGAPGDAAPGGAAGRPDHARRDRDAAGQAGAYPGRGSRTCAPASPARPCAASSRPTRARRSPGTTSRSSASGRGCRSC